MTSFGKYQVLEQIGQGGFGRVYRGWGPVLEREVAIKAVSLSAPQARERFVREAEIAANLRLPHIVTVFDFGEQDDQPYLVQEFLPGWDLEELIGAGMSGDLRTRVGFLVQAAEALHYAHSRGVVHRDIKPGNLRTLADGSLRVMDFGIAKILDGRRRPHRHRDEHRHVGLPGARTAGGAADRSPRRHLLVRCGGV